VDSAKISWEGGDVAPFPRSRVDRKKTQTTASVPKKSVSLQGCTPHQCARCETKLCTQRAAILQQVIHDDQPGRAHHDAKTSCEMINEPKLASEGAHIRHLAGSTRLLV
jgi:hypothetical protein